MNHKNPYFRLQQYFTLFIYNEEYSFHAENQVINIKEIHEKMKLPIMVVRKDICNLYLFGNVIGFDFDAEEYDRINREYSDILEKDLKKMNMAEVDQFRKLALEGVFDLIPLEMLMSFGSRCDIALSFGEADALYTYISKIQDKLNTSFHSDYRIKDHYRARKTADFIEIINRVNQAILNHKAVEINYITSKGIRETYKLNPLKISYNNLDNRYAIIAVHNNKNVMVYNMDRITSIKEIERLAADEENNLNLISHYTKVWGNSFEAPKYEVKVRFKKEANVWEKVKKDIYYRTPEKLEENDLYLEYEDVVYGIEKFRSWILGFGSSVEVLSPKSLREDIIKSLKARAELYQLF